MLVGVLDGLMMNSCAVEMLLMKFTVLIREYQVNKDFVYTNSALQSMLDFIIHSGSNE